MIRPWIIAILGVVCALAGFITFYGSRTAEYRKLEAECGPELAWIKKEFRLADDEFERVKKLHEAYKPVCAEMCRQVDEQNRELARLLQTAQGVTPEIEKTLGRAAEIRKECQTGMLSHFFRVSQAMPPEQGRRYLAWMQAQTLLPTHESMLPKIGAKSDDDRDAHR
ncbi:MAG: hypothetical protein JNN01_20000 [Opitutaceae bacterium]|nr:hypothetical protein [Opitutaceae bacterium]